jgi:hypothetical protein
MYEMTHACAPIADAEEFPVSGKLDVHDRGHFCRHKSV